MVRTYFYYLRDKNKRPLVTVCLHCIDDKYYRGVSICSPKDSPIKRVGRNIAFGRALQAVKRGGSILSKCRKEAIDTYNEVKSFFLYNSTNIPILNRIEKKLIKRKDKKAGE